MAGEELCTVKDVYRYATAYGGLSARAQSVSAVVGSVLEVEGAGLERNDPLELRAFDGGTLPAGAERGVVYYADPVTGREDAFRLLDAVDGAVVTLTTSGEAFGIVRSLEPLITAQIRSVTQWIFRRLPAHSVPLVADGNGNYPETVRAMCAVLAAEATAVVLGITLPRLTEAAERMRSEARLLLAGLPMRDTGDTSTADNLATGASPSAIDEESVP